MKTSQQAELECFQCLVSFSSRLGDQEGYSTVRAGYTYTFALFQGVSGYQRRCENSCKTDLKIIISQFACNYLALGKL